MFPVGNPTFIGKPAEVSVPGKTTYFFDALGPRIGAGHHLITVGPAAGQFRVCLRPRSATNAGDG